MRTCIHLYVSMYVHITTSLECAKPPLCINCVIYFHAGSFCDYMLRKCTYTYIHICIQYTNLAFAFVSRFN